MRKDEIVPRDYGNLLDRVAAIFTKARRKAIRDINLTQVIAYYEIGPNWKAKLPPLPILRHCCPGLIPEDAIKDPYILEFLNLKEETAYTDEFLFELLPGE